MAGDLFDQERLAAAYEAAHKRLSVDPAARRPVIRARVRIVEGLLKEARTGTFTFLSDEPAAMGGGDTAPYPLQYLVASVGF